MASASKNLSRALAPEGIIVNTVAPGTVMSPTLAGYLVGTDLEGLPEGPLEAAYEAIVCGARRLTYAEADERATRLAHHLASRGIGAHDHVALYLANGTEYLEA